MRTLRDGTAITIRPLAPDDREAFRQAWHETSASTRYLRFFGAMTELSEDTLDYLTNVDQDRHIALVATTTSPDLKTERGIGVARLIRSAADPTVAEAAITVADDAQRKGVGVALARELTRAARARGVHTIRAEVLAENTAMRTILEQAGAKLAPHRTSPTTLLYDLAITQRPMPEARLVELLRGAAETMAMTIRKLVPPGRLGLAPDPDPQDD
ncbi:MAG: acetyltransferase, family [Labilithrix sp.]|nr:acetyltransferase, family [Labilithrix sp.]